jgi:primosomal protein N' (replication factor Y)
MVTKGHDLPGVTLVGVLNADAALAFPDFQASERTFQLLVQVAGRAGRGETPGVVLIQTRNPDHPAIRHAVDHDVESFIEAELAERSELHYPPYARLALVRVEAVDRRLAERVVAELAELARRAAPRAEVSPPSPAPLLRLRNRYRHRFLVKAKVRSAVRQALIAVLRHPGDRRVRVSIDIDPLHML